MTSSKKFFSGIMLSGIVLFSFTAFQAVFAQKLPGDYLEVPRPQAFVSDFAEILSPETEQSLNTSLTEFEQQTGNEIAVVTVPNLQDTTIEDFAVRLFEKWGIGKKGRDNGLLFIIAPNDRQARIEVGYGLEPIITDSVTGRILRNEAFEAFKAGNYDLGVAGVVSSLITVIRDKGSTENLPPDRFNATASSPWLNFFGYLFNPVIFFFIFAFFSYLASYFGRSKRIWPGGLIGGIFGAILGVLLFAWFGLVAGFFVLGGLGLLFDYIVSKNYAYRKAHGLPTDFRHSGGGFWFGGGGGRGGFGGGFGGFGGGRSGGGGGGIRW